MYPFILCWSVNSLNIILIFEKFAKKKLALLNMDAKLVNSQCKLYTLLLKSD